MNKSANANSIKGGLQQRLLEEVSKTLSTISEGTVVDGVVVLVSSDTVFVDIGYKSEGKVDLSEFDTPPQVGDTLKVYVVRKDGRQGLILSKKKVEEKAALAAIRDAGANHEPVLGTFVKVSKNAEGNPVGYEVRLEGSAVTAFCPLSKADSTFVRNPETLIGVEDYFVIEKAGGGRFNKQATVNRREFLETRTRENKKVFFEKANEGDVVEGRVKDIVQFGAFVDIGGFDGLLHINDLSWSHVKHVEDVVKVGQELQLKIIKMDPEKSEINLSLKDMQPNPWDTFSSRHEVNEVVKGKVVKLMTFGAFVEIEPGIEGLVHITELSWTRHITDPKEVLRVGQEVEVKILGWDLDAKRISLGYKQTLDNPWDTISSKYPVGSKVKCTIRKTTEPGVFVTLEDGIDAYLPSDEVSWTEKVKDMTTKFKEGEKLEVVIVRVDDVQKKIRVSLKQASEDPWAVIKKNFPKYSVIKGNVSRIESFGVFVKVAGDIEGLINKSLLGNDDSGKAKTVSDFKVGDEVSAMVMDINPGANRLSLSISDIGKREAEKSLEKFMADSKDDKETGFTLGDLLNKK